MDSKTRNEVQALNRQFWANEEKNWRDAGLEGFSYSNSCGNIRRGKRSISGQLSQDQSEALVYIAEQEFEHFA